MSEFHVTVVRLGEITKHPNADSLSLPHVREGFVVRLVKERWDVQCGRVILKLVGEDYLLRK